MRCMRCERGSSSTPTPRRPTRRLHISTCDRCGAAILTLQGVAVGDGGDTLTRLARFGLAETEELLLEPQREGT